MKAKKTWHRVSRTSIWLISLWRALQQKFYHQDFRDVDHLKRVLLHCWVWVISTQTRWIPINLLMFIISIMQRIFKYGDIQNINLTLNEETTILIYWPPSYVIMYRSYTLWKMCGFYWATLHTYICHVYGGTCLGRGTGPCCLMLTKCQAK